MIKIRNLFFAFVYLSNMNLMVNANENFNFDDFNVQNFKEEEVRFSDSERKKNIDYKADENRKAIVRENWGDRDVSFAYHHKSVGEIISQIFKLSGQSVLGLEPLMAIKRRVLMKRVKAYKAVNILLRCEGYRLIDKHTYYEVKADKNIKRNNCLY